MLSVRCSKLFTSKFTAQSSILSIHRHSFINFDFDKDFDKDFDEFDRNFSIGLQQQKQHMQRPPSQVDSSRMRSDFNPKFNSFDSGFNNRNSQKLAKARIQWSDENLTPFKKNFYEQHKNIAQMSETDVSKFRENNGMIVFGSNIPKPFKTFSESGIPENCLQHLSKIGIEQPSAIQQQGIPMALSGRDVVGISRTGSGKTLAYLLPLIVHINAQPIVQKGDGPIGLIIAPTRELTLQINKEISLYVQSNPTIQLNHCAVYGGSDRQQQIQRLRQSPDIIVATPGRLMDLLSSGETNFKRTTYLVFDEADRMLDMGFKQDLEIILSYVRPDRQTLMWSATWPPDIENIANQYMNNPVRVQIGSTDLHANQNIEQNFVFVSSDYEKEEKFLAHMKELLDAGKKSLVFTNTKRMADMLERKLERVTNHGCRSLHSDKTQAQREMILDGFRRSNIKVLIATDVVSRGIDIRDIACVVVYDFPTNVEDYVHRIGRTARADDNGISVAYMTNEDCYRCGKKLCQVLKKSKQNIPGFLQQKQGSQLQW